MTNEEHEARLQAALVEYLEALEAGQTPNREAFLARHPEVAEELAEHLSNRDHLGSLLSPPPSPGSEVGKKVRYFGDYELLEEVARGGMGVVYKARQVNLNRVVALKMILAGQLAGDDEVRRFHAEAESAAKLDHPNIVPIFEIGEHEGQHYFSMAYVEGESLARRLATGVFSPDDAANLLIQVSEAIAYAHIEGVIHRDLKPSNVLLDKEGKPRVTDFGLAKRIDADSELTNTGQVLGSPSYMPPEQASGKTDEIGPHSDVYALGAMLYCLLSGRPPFQASTAVDTLAQVLHQDPVPLRQLNRSIPRDLETICSKCLEKQPARRYSSAQELVEELHRFTNNEPILARPAGSVQRLWRWCQRNRLAASLAAALVFAMLMGTTIATRFAIVAKRNADLARMQAYRAHLNAEKAREGAKEAELARKRVQMQLYAASLREAQQAWDDGKLEQMKQMKMLLGGDRPEQGQADLRGWEWHYLRSLLPRNEKTLELSKNFHKGAHSSTGVRQRPLWEVSTAKLIETLERVWNLADKPPDDLEQDESGKSSR